MVQQMPPWNDDDASHRATDGLDWSSTPRVTNAPPETTSTPGGPPPASRPPGLLKTFGVAAFGALAGGALVAAAVFVAGIGDEAPASHQDAPPTSTLLTVEQTSAVAEAAARGRQSIVKILSTRKTANGALEQDIGSGVIIDDQGHIVTNAHVVQGTETLKVFLVDGTEQPAILVGHDYPFNDIAVLQIGPGKAGPLEIGDSSALQPGETVVAVGNPLAEFDFSISVGVVSALNRRRILDGVRQDDLIQTDAALNSGNSGGALVNLRGQFVGMPTLVLRQGRTGAPIEGLGFALPSNHVMEVARRIIAANGAIARPSLGLDHLDITAELVDRARLAVEEGAVVRSVVAGGAAAMAGIQPGDIITRVGDVDVNKDTPLLNALIDLEAGQSVSVVLNRSGRIIEVEVRLTART
jgi:S1-C subfamily serine protease